MNIEGYNDPTAETAISNIDKRNTFMPFVYICAAYNDGNDDCVDRHKAYCKYVYDSGYLPIDPYLLFNQFLEIEKDKDRFLLVCKAFLSHCNSMYIFGEEDTEDMKILIAKAQRKGKRVQRVAGRLAAI